MYFVNHDYFVNGFINKRNENKIIYFKIKSKLFSYEVSIRFVQIVMVLFINYV